MRLDKLMYNFKTLTNSEGVEQMTICFGDIVMFVKKGVKNQSHLNE